MIDILTHSWSRRGLIAFIITQIVCLGLRLFYSIDKPWFKLIFDASTILASICTVWALILTIDIYKESKEISKSVEQVAKAKQFELTKYKKFMSDIEQCLTALSKFILVPSAKAKTNYFSTVLQFRSDLHSICMTLKNYNRELTEHLDADAVKEFKEANDFIYSYSKDIDNKINQHNDSIMLFDNLGRLKSLAEDFNQNN